MKRLACLIALAACGKSAEECRMEAEALTKLLQDTPHEPGAFFPQRDVTLVLRTDLKEVAGWDSLVVTGTKETVTFQGAPLSGGDDLLERLESLERRRPVKDTSRIYFQLDRETPWRTVVQLVDTAKRATFKTVGFAFSTGEKLTPPPRAPIDDKLDALMNGEAANKAVELAKLMETEIENCPALKKEFGKVSAESAESKADVIIRGITPALVDCNCKVDMAAFRSLMWRVMAVDPAVKVLVFDTTTGDTLALPGATTWEEASKKLVHGKATQLAVE